MGDQENDLSIVACLCHENLDKAPNDNGDNTDLNNDHHDPYPGERYM